MTPDPNALDITQLDEPSYRRVMWERIERMHSDIQGEFKQVKARQDRTNGRILSLEMDQVREKARREAWVKLAGFAIGLLGILGPIASGLVAIWWGN